MNNLKADLKITLLVCPLFFHKIVEIERFTLRLPSCRSVKNYYLKIKMAAINGKTRYISTKSQKNRGL